MLHKNALSGIAIHLTKEIQDIIISRRDCNVSLKLNKLYKREYNKNSSYCSKEQHLKEQQEYVRIHRARSGSEDFDRILWLSEREMETRARARARRKPARAGSTRPIAPDQSHVTRCEERRSDCFSWMYGHLCWQG